MASKWAVIGYFNVYHSQLWWAKYTRFSTMTSRQPPPLPHRSTVYGFPSVGPSKCVVVSWFNWYHSHFDELERCWWTALKWKKKINLWIGQLIWSCSNRQFGCELHIEAYHSHFDELDCDKSQQIPRGVDCRWFSGDLDEIVMQITSLISCAVKRFVCIVSQPALMSEVVLL